MASLSRIIGGQGLVQLGVTARQAGLASRKSKAVRTKAGQLIKATIRAGLRQRAAASAVEKQAARAAANASRVGARTAAYGLGLRARYAQADTTLNQQLQRVGLANAVSNIRTNLRAARMTSQLRRVENRDWALRRAQNAMLQRVRNAKNVRLRMADARLANAKRGVELQRAVRQVQRQVQGARARQQLTAAETASRRAAAAAMARAREVQARGLLKAGLLDRAAAQMSGRGFGGPSLATLVRDAATQRTRMYTNVRDIM